MKRTPFKRSAKPSLKASARLARHGRLRVAGQTSTAELKREIQALLRELVILRDGECILYGIRCQNKYGDPGVVWQAEHLIERSNSATFADDRLVVLVCKNCHGWKHFTKSNHDQYDAWVRTRLSPQRVQLWDACRADQWRPTHKGSYDWKLAKLALEQEVARLKGRSGDNRLTSVTP